jgi:hypothetical protein
VLKRTLLQSVPEVLARMDDFLNDHNAMNKRPMKLAMFLYAAEHISRACRILKQPGAHLLSIGVGGSGRASLGRLAAYINGMTVCQVRSIRGPPIHSDGCSLYGLLARGLECSVSAIREVSFENPGSCSNRVFPKEGSSMYPPAFVCSSTQQITSPHGRILQVEVTKAYTAVEWRDDLRRFTRMCASRMTANSFLTGLAADVER